MIQFIRVLIVLAVLFGASGCNSRIPAENLKASLDSTMTADLLILCSETADSMRLSKPYVMIDSFEIFSSGAYASKATISFYLLQSIRMKVCRNYRFVNKTKVWESYVNEWRFISDTADN